MWGSSGLLSSWIFMVEGDLSLIALCINLRFSTQRAQIPLYSISGNITEQNLWIICCNICEWHRLHTFTFHWNKKAKKQKKQKHPTLWKKTTKQTKPWGTTYYTRPFLRVLRDKVIMIIVTKCLKYWHHNLKCKSSPPPTPTPTPTPSGNFCLLLITFANRLDPGQARQNVKPDLDPNCLTLW